MRGIFPALAALLVAAGVGIGMLGPASSAGSISGAAAAARAAATAATAAGPGSAGASGAAAGAAGNSATGAATTASNSVNAPQSGGAATAPATARAADYYALSAEEFFKRPEVAERIGKDKFNLALLEAAVFQQTNRERVKENLPVFKYSAAMNLMARRHSTEMATLQFFDHQSPTPANATLADRLKNVGVTGVISGENIAVLPAKEMGSGHYISHPGEPEGVWFDEVTGKRIDYYTYEELAKDVLTGWMNSPHHHENIVNRQYVYLGVGAGRGPYDENHQDSFYFTQNFSSGIVGTAEGKARGLLVKP